MSLSAPERYKPSLDETIFTGCARNVHKRNQMSTKKSNTIPGDGMALHVAGLEKLWVSDNVSNECMDCKAALRFPNHVLTIVRYAVYSFVVRLSHKI